MPERTTTESLGTT